MPEIMITISSLLKQNKTITAVFNKVIVNIFLQTLNVKLKKCLINCTKLLFDLAEKCAVLYGIRSMFVDLETGLMDSVLDSPAVSPESFGVFATIRAADTSYSLVPYCPKYNLT